MKKSILIKDTFREIKTTSKRYLSLILIICVGAGFFTGVKTTAPTIKASAEEYFKQTDLMDFKIMSEAGFGDSDADAIRALDGVKYVEVGYSVDCVLDSSDGGVARLMSVPAEQADGRSINAPTITEGRMPQNTGECIVMTNETLGHDLKIGDTVRLLDDETTEEMTSLLNVLEYKVVGICRSPLLFSYNLGTTNVGTGMINVSAYILPEDFSLPRYTVMYVNLDVEGSAFSDDYDALIDSFTETLKTESKPLYDAYVADVQAQIDEFDEKYASGNAELAAAEEQLEKAALELEEAKTQLEDGWAEYNTSKADAEAQLADARAQLDEALATIAESEKQLKDGWAEYNASYDSARAELDDGWKQYNDGMAQLSSYSAEVADGQAQLDDAKRQLDEARTQYEDGLAAYEAGLAEYEDGLAEYETKREEFEQGKLQLEEGKKQYEEGFRQYSEGLEQYKEGLAQFEEQSAGMDEYTAGQEKIEAAEKELEDGKAQYQAGLKQYQDGQKQLTAAKTQLDESKATLDAGEKQYEDGLAEYEEGEKEYADGVKKINEFDSAQAVYEKVSYKTDRGQTVTEDERTEMYTSLMVLIKGTEYEQYSSQLATASAPLLVSYWRDNTANVDMTDYRKQLSDARVQLDDAKKTLEDSRKQLDDGWEQYNQGVKDYEDGVAQAAEAKITLDESKKQIEDGEKQLAEAKAQLAEASPEVEAAMPEYEAAKKQLEDAKAELDKSLEQLAAAKEEIDANEKLIADGEIQLAEAKKTLDEAAATLEENKKTLDAVPAQLEAAQLEYDAGVREFNEGNREYTDSLARLRDAKAQLDEGEAKLADSYKQLTDGDAELAQGKLEAEQGEKEYAEAKAQADKELAEALATLNDAQAQYDKGLAEYNDGLAQFEKSKDEANSALSGAEKLISSIKENIGVLEEGGWFIFDRDTIVVNYNMIESNADNVDAIARVFPIFFLAVASLVCLTTISRMVDEERTQMGIYKALGYSAGDIMFKYVFYAVTAAVIGSVIGQVIGILIIPKAIVAAYVMLFSFPVTVLSPTPAIVAVSFLTTLLCMVAVVLYCCLRELKVTTASLMRPKAPKAGSHIAIERIGPVWKRLSFSVKNSLRNIFRYKTRMAMTIIGVFGCMSLMVAGFGLNDSISDVVEIQYGRLHKYTVIKTYADGFGFDDAALEKVSMESDPRVDGAMMTDADKVNVINPADNAIAMSDVTLFVPQYPEDFSRYIELNDPKTHEKLTLGDDGAVITQKLAERLGISAGDELSFLRENVLYTIKIANVAESYLLNYIYMTPAMFESAIGMEPSFDNAYIIESELMDDRSAYIAQTLSGDSGVLTMYGVDMMSDIFDQVVNNLRAVVVVMIISAGALAFIVVYNLTNINISERVREIATINVLGFTDGESNLYIFRENVYMSAFAMLLGIPGGYLLTKLIVTVIDADELMMVAKVSPLSFLWSMLLTVVFIVLVSVVMSLRVRKIDMVESMKAVE